ncbi:MAG: RNA 2',3'-cyclic phosphodiesterase [Woeseiaceae bacterium]|nr:RNA 2',3'-cyclic phosphodiesterase [Woeseiaceae bacterium]
MSNKTLFFALWPSHRQREMIRDSFGPALSTVEGTSVDRRNWHITLVYIGDFPEEKIPDLLSAVEIIDPGEIRLRFDTLTFWPRSKIACLHALTVPPGLAHLVQSLQQALIPFGHEPDPRVYRPHITMSRKARSFQEVRPARPIELTWTDFDLVESVSFRGETRYHPVKQ